MDDWNLISFIMSGKLRFKILVELKMSEKTPTDLSTVLKIPISHISKTLSELQEAQLIICLTPNRRKKKFFKITEQGIELLSSINKMTKI